MSLEKKTKKKKNGLSIIHKRLSSSLCDSWVTKLASVKKNDMLRSFSVQN